MNISLLLIGYALVCSPGLGSDPAVVETMEEPGVQKIWINSFFGETVEVVDPKCGIVTARREGKLWKFKIFAGSSGWSGSSSLERGVLKGKGFEIPLMAQAFAYAGDQHLDLTLSDELVKSGVVELWVSYMGRGGNSRTHYTIALAEVVNLVKEEDGAQAQPEKAALTAELKNARALETEEPAILVDFVLHNHSERPIRLAERWNSWGAYQWTFTLKDANGKELHFRNPQTSWWRNAFTVFTIPAGESHTLKCLLYDRGVSVKVPGLVGFSCGFWLDLDAVVVGRGGELRKIERGWTYPVQVVGSFQAEVHGRPPLTEFKTDWAGKIATNEVTLEAPAAR